MLTRSAKSSNLVYVCIYGKAEAKKIATATHEKKKIETDTLAC